MRRVVLVLAVLLGGCAGERTVTTVFTSSGGIPVSTVSALAVSRRVEVHGTPPDGATAEAVAAVVRVPGQRNPTPFAVAPAASDGLRLVIEFGVMGGGDPACRTPRGVGSTMPLVMSVTLCEGGSAQSTATMRSDAIRGPSDPAFAGAMDRVVIALTPAVVTRPFDR